MPIYRIPLEKEYHNRKGSHVMISGHLDIEAESVEDAELKHTAMVKAVLQSADPRIVWYWADSGWTWEDLIDKGYEYVDWSFGIPEGESIELKPEDDDE